VKLLPEIPDFDEVAHASGYSSQVMAWKLNVSTRTLQRYADQHFGCVLTEHLRRLRMAKALEMIEGGAQFKVVSAELGFKQYTHFCREFKAAHGLSPANWMNNSQEIMPPFCKKHQVVIRQRLRSLKRERREQTPGIRALP
jgi:AraC-like DNA-binding protein